ncbi:cytochrome c oxidase subunit 1 [Blyttiomyces sp. JEL0837]|nr:cytochrome c oxidase subunit 1 [Blyttiomyces sp. JEL0837]
MRVKDADDIPLMLVGNKCDKVGEREVSREEGYHLARRLRCEFIETSAKTCVNVEKDGIKAGKEINAVLSGQISSSKTSGHPNVSSTLTPFVNTNKPKDLRKPVVDQVSLNVVEESKETYKSQQDGVVGSQTANVTAGTIAAGIATSNPPPLPPKLTTTSGTSPTGTGTGTAATAVLLLAPPDSAGNGNGGDDHLRLSVASSVGGISRRLGASQEFGFAGGSTSELGSRRKMNDMIVRSHHGSKRGSGDILITTNSNVPKISRLNPAPPRSMATTASSKRMQSSGSGASPVTAASKIASAITSPSKGTPRVTRTPGTAAGNAVNKHTMLSHASTAASLGISALEFDDESGYEGDNGSLQQQPQQQQRSRSPNPNHRGGASSPVYSTSGFRPASRVTLDSSVFAGTIGHARGSHVMDDAGFSAVDEGSLLEHTVSDETNGRLKADIESDRGLVQQQQQQQSQAAHHLVGHMMSAGGAGGNPYRKSRVTDTGFGKASTGRLLEPSLSFQHHHQMTAGSAPGTSTSMGVSGKPLEAVLVGNKLDATALASQDPLISSRIAAMKTRSKMNVLKSIETASTERTDSDDVKMDGSGGSDEGFNNAGNAESDWGTGAVPAVGADVMQVSVRPDPASLEDLIQEEEEEMEEEVEQVEEVEPVQSPVPVIESFEQVDNLIKKYEKFWQKRARKLRYEPSPPPTPSKDAEGSVASGNVGEGDVARAESVVKLIYLDGDTLPEQAGMDMQQSMERRSTIACAGVDERKFITISGADEHRRSTVVSVTQPQDRQSMTIGRAEERRFTVVQIEKGTQNQAPVVEVTMFEHQQGDHANSVTGVSEDIKSTTQKSTSFFEVSNASGKSRRANQTLLGPRYPPTFVADPGAVSERDSSRSESSDSVSTTDSNFLARKNMIITSLQTLQRNLKRKLGSQGPTPVPQDSNNIQINFPPHPSPWITVSNEPENELQAEGDALKASQSDNIYSEEQWPPFAKLEVPDQFLINYKSRPTSRASHILQLSGIQMEVDPEDTELEHWWLEENAYSNEALKKAKMEDDVKHQHELQQLEHAHEKHGASDVHSHHHRHEPLTDSLAQSEYPKFTCDPAVQPVYAEALYAEQQAERRHRPQYVPAPGDLGVLKDKTRLDLDPDAIDDENLGSEERLSEVSAPGPPFMPSTSAANRVMTTRGLHIDGKSMLIQPVSVAAGSAAIGLPWSPAPPKLSLSMKLYSHAHSVPATPKPGSQQTHGKGHLHPDQIESIIATAESRDEMNVDVATKYSGFGIGAHSSLPYDRALEENLVNPQQWVGPNSVYAGTTFPPMAMDEGSPVYMDIFNNPNGKEKLPLLVPEEEFADDSIIAATFDEVMPDKIDHNLESEDETTNNEQTATNQELDSKSGLLAPPASEMTASSSENEIHPLPLPRAVKARKGRTFQIGRKKKAKRSRLASIESYTSAEGSATESEQADQNVSNQNAPPIPNAPQKSVSESKDDVNKKDKEKDGSDPADFYLRRMRSNQSMISAAESSEPTPMSTRPGSASTSSFFRSMSSSFSYLDGRRSVNKRDDSVVTKGEKRRESNVLAVPAGPNWFEMVHDIEKRHLMMTPAELAKYPSLTDPGPPEELVNIEGEQATEPAVEIDKLTTLISSSSLPIPAFLRRRGILLCRVGRYDEAMADLSKAIHFDPFNSDALWQRHQLYLRLGDTEQALRDLDAITETNKQHLGAFLSKARIYQELSLEERASGMPPDSGTIGLIKLAIVNYSQVIRLKPEISDGYYQRACLFEAENEMVYANEDFKMVRQLDPTNEHAIHNLAVYSFQRQLWDDAIQAFTKLIRLNFENGQAYLYRGRANAFLAKWDEALRDLTMAIQLAPDRADVFYFRGCLLRERNRRKAIEDFSVSILIDDGPNNVEAVFQRAVMYYRLKKYDLAVADYMTVVDLDPNKAMAWLNLGVIYMRFFNEYYKALHCFDKAIFHDPIMLRAYLCRGDLFQILHSDSFDEFAESGGADKKAAKKNRGAIGYIDRAIRDYSKAIHLCPGDYLLYLYRGRLLLKEGKMKEATYDFHSAFELNAGIAQTFVQRALVLSFQRKYKQIIDEFNQRSKLETIDDPALYMLIAKARVKCGDNEGAIADLSKALEHSRKDPQIFLHRGICYENLKDWTNAAIEFTKCIQQNPGFAKAYYHRGLCKLHEGHSKGVHDLDKALKLDPKFFEAYLSRASYHHSQNSYVEGIEDCNEALKLEPTSIRAHLLRGACKCKLHQYGLAIIDFTKAIQLDKACHFAFYNRAVTYQLLEDFGNAIKDYSIVLLLHDDSNAYRNRGLIYWKQGDAENALLDLYAARDNFPEDARLHGLLALCLQKVGRTDESLAAFSSAIEVNQTLIEAYLGRGNVYASIGNTKAAMRDYARVIHMYPRCAEAYVNMAYALQSANRFKKAWELFTFAIAINPLCTPALEGRSVVHYSMQNYFGALIDISKAIEISPTNAEYYANRGVIYQALNDFIHALHDQKEAIRLDPQYALPYFNSANLYFSQGRWEQALENYTRALELDQNDVSATLNRGITKANLNDIRGALEDLSRAAQMSPYSAEVYFNRAQLLQKLGRYDLADLDYTRVLKLSPNDSTTYLKRGETRGHRGQKDLAMKDFAQHIILQK